MASAKAGDAEGLGEGPWPILVGVWASGRNGRGKQALSLGFGGDTAIKRAFPY